MFGVILRKGTIREKSKVQEQKVAKQRAELARLKKQERETERKRRTKSVILLGSALEVVVSKEHRADLHAAVLEAEKNPADLRAIVLKLARRLSTTSG